MTTFCKPIGRLRFAALFDGRLQKFGVYQRVVEGKSTETHQSLTDGTNIVCFCGQPNGYVAQIVVRGPNDPSSIFDAIFQALDVKIVTDREPEFWGFKTEQEWQEACERAEEACAREEDENF